MIGEYQPMLFEPAPPGMKFDQSWIVEEKHDGDRIVLFHMCGRVSMYTRTGKPCTSKFPEIEAAAILLPEGVYDCELTMPGGPAIVSGRMHSNDFQARLYARSQPATLHMFDVLRFNDRDLKRTPLIERKNILYGIDAPPRIEIVRHEDAADVEDQFARIVERGGEGIVLKRKQSPYMSGTRSALWLKMKRSMDVHVYVVGATKSDALPFGALILAKDGQFYGKVGTGFSDADRRKILATLAARQTQAPAVRLPGDVGRDLLISCQPMPAEITVQEETTNKDGGHAPRHPTGFRWRPDLKEANA